MKSFCVVKHGEALVLNEHPVPIPVGTEVLVQVVTTGLCHTDLHLWDGYYDLGGGNKLMLADRGIKPPLVLGHEVVGKIAGGGDQVHDLNHGATVLVHPWIGCGTCVACRRGEENICANPQALGVARPGGFADYVVVPHPRYLVDIGHLDPRSAAPLACAGVTVYSALKKFGSRIHEGPVVIFGAGGLGLMAIRVLKAMGGVGAVVVARDPVKRDAATAAGALEVIDLQSNDAAKSIIRATDGGARAVLDLVSAPETLAVALESMARGGHIVACGLIGGAYSLALPSLVLRPIKLEGSYVGTVDELGELVALAKAGKLEAIPVTVHPLSNINAAVSDLANGRVTGRIVVEP